MATEIMMGTASRKEFSDRVNAGPKPMSENERRAYAAQCYPNLLDEGFRQSPNQELQAH